MRSLVQAAGSQLIHNNSLSIDDIPGASPKKHLAVRSVKRSNFFPDSPETETLMLKDKRPLVVSQTAVLVPDLSKQTILNYYEKLCHSPAHEYPKMA